MDFSSTIPTFVITLREGVEATLVVGIVLAYLKKAGKSRFNPWVYAGIGVGIALSALVGMLFTQIILSLGTANQKYAPVIEPLLEGIFSVLAIAMLSWMLLWMTQQAKLMKGQVQDSVTAALQQESRAGWAIFGLILVAVLREGFETVLFVVAKFQQGWVPALGAVMGMGTAVAIGILLFKWGVRINLRLFFMAMGVLLLLIVAGLVVMALGHFDTAVASLAGMDRKSEGLCIFYERFVKNPSCILGPKVWDLSPVLPDDRFPGVLLNALFGYTQRLFLVQAIAYGLFILSIGTLYFRSLGIPLPFRSFKPGRC
jgi:high-affinity iron transporter